MIYCADCLEPLVWLGAHPQPINPVYCPACKAERDQEEQ